MWEMLSQSDSKERRGTKKAPVDPTTSGDAQQPADQRTGESSQGDSRTERSNGGGFGWLLGWTVVLILIAVGGHYAWSYYEDHGSPVTYHGSNTPCAEYTFSKLGYNYKTTFSPYVVSSKDAIKEDPSNPMGYQQPPCGANLVDVGRRQISYLCTINCQGNPDVEGKKLQLQFFRIDNHRGGAIRPIPNGSRTEWTVRHGAPPPSIPAGTDYVFVWFVTDTPLTGPLRMEARL
jgi:hypothetical protein